MSEHTMHLNAPPEALDDDPPLSGLMTHQLLGITPDAELRVALRLLASAGVRHLPVLDGNACIGVITEADVLRALTQPRPLLGPSPMVAQLCRPAPALKAGDRRTVAAAAMHDTGLDVVLVIEHGLLVGIVTATDLVRSLAPGQTARPAAPVQASRSSVTDREGSPVPGPATERTSGPAGTTLPRGIVVG